MKDKIIIGDALEELKKLESESIDCCVTSPPYFGLRDYGHDDQIGLEKTPREYVEKLAIVFSEVSRVLKNDGTLWLNLGDSYSGNGGYKDKNNIGDKQRTNNGSLGNQYRNPGTMGLKPKDLIGIPWMVAFALRDQGWYLRQDIIWHKPNPMPESVKDRFTKAHEYIFLFSKSKDYYFDQNSVLVPQVESERLQRLKEQKIGIDTKYNISRDGKTGLIDHSETGAIKSAVARQKLAQKGVKNRRSVWKVSTKPYKGAHFATFPPDLIKPCVLAGCPEGGTVIDPFGGSGTVGQVSRETGRNFILIEINLEYKPLIEKRIQSSHYQKSF